MDVKKISNELSVSGQIAVDDVAALAEQGFRAVICNRPDGEGADQPNFEEIEEAAKKAGMEARYIPIVSGKVGDDDAAAFGDALQSLPKPVLAYCRSGTRSTTLWSLAQADRMPLADILAAAKRAGYDMSGVFRLPRQDR